MQNPPICPFLVHAAATRNITGIRWKTHAVRSVYRFRSTRSDVHPGDPMPGGPGANVYSFSAMRSCANACAHRVHRAALAKEKNDAE
jgi:hypothetical protein